MNNNKVVGKKKRETNIALAKQIEAIVQGLANASFLVFPFIITANPDKQISVFQYFSIWGFKVILWLGAFKMEIIADRKKLCFYAKLDS